MKRVSEIIEYLPALIWDADLRDAPRWKVWLVRTARLVYVVARDIAKGQVTLRAMSLVYTTLLSLVPLLAVSFSILKAFGVHHQIEPVLLNFLEPMGEQGVEITARLVGFVDNVRAGLLGSVGLAFLFYTVISLLQKVERSFNDTWFVERGRSFAQRFSHYLSVIVVGPVLVVAAMGASATLMSTAAMQWLLAIQPFGYLLELASRLTPYVLIVTAFTFAYLFIPNTKVRFKSALVGGLVAGVLWQTIGWAFTSFVVNSAKYTAIYSAFASLILFMVWVYLSWMVLLIGASIAFYHQNPEYLTASRREIRLSNRGREKLALLVMRRIGERFYLCEPPQTLEQLAKWLRLPAKVVQRVLTALQDHGLLTVTDAEPPGWIPARPLEATPVTEVLEAVRASHEAAGTAESELAGDVVVDGLVSAFERAVGETLSEYTCKDLALSGQMVPPANTTDSGN
ncbi:MAG: YihY family inner membrane protein [Pseudomonadota bacterium]|nr:MAG: YihY family inner membrane protein [Pseudomonadota bacterium]